MSTSTIIIILNFYDADILRNLYNLEQGRAKVICQNEGQPNIYGGNAISNKYVLSFSESSYSFRCFHSDGEFTPDPRRSDRESAFVKVNLCFRHNKLCEI